MNLHLPLRIAALLALLLLGAQPASDCQAQEDDKPATSKQIQGWIRDLSSDRFLVREEATEELAKAGLPAIKPLESAIRKGDREVATRGVQALQKLALDGDEPQQRAAFEALDTIVEANLRTASSLAKATLDRIANVRQQAAIDILSSLGARIETNYRQVGFKAQLYAWSIQIDEAWRGADKDLENLRWLRDIQQVVLVGGQVKDDWFQYLRKMHSLAYLVVKRANVSDKCMTDVGKLAGLDVLELKYVNISDRSVAQIKSLNNATSIKLYGTQITNQAADELRAKLGAGVIDYRAGAFLGVGCRPHPLGCEIGQVHPNSAAKRAKIEPGDVIVRYAGKVVRDFEMLTKYISQHKVNQKVVVQVARGAETRIYTVRQDAELAIEGKAHLLGYALTAVDPGGVAASAGLQKGDIIFRVGSTAVSDAKSFDKALKEQNDIRPILQVVRGAELIKKEIVLGEWD